VRWGLLPRAAPAAARPSVTQHLLPDWYPTATAPPAGVRARSGFPSIRAADCHPGLARWPQAVRSPQGRSGQRSWLSRSANAGAAGPRNGDGMSGPGTGPPGGGPPGAGDGIGSGGPGAGSGGTGAGPPGPGGNGVCVTSGARSGGRTSTRSVASEGEDITGCTPNSGRARPHHPHHPTALSRHGLSIPRQAGAGCEGVRQVWASR